MMAIADKRTSLITPILVAGSIIILVSFAIRASFGVFQIPIATEFGWFRNDFSLAIAIQNLAWGLGQPLFGAIAEKMGDRKAIVFGALVYAFGLSLSSFAVTPGQHQILEIFVGFGIAGTGFGVILAMVGRASSADNRSVSLGIATAAGSAGQVFGAPASEWMLGFMSWQEVFLIFAVCILLVLFTLPMIRSPKIAARSELQDGLGHTLMIAFKTPSYLMIFAGFFSCGYQLAFMTAHFPALVTEMSQSIDPDSWLSWFGCTTTSALGAVSISLIGVTNIVGTLAAGWLGKIYSKKLLLCAIYAGRTGLAIWFILTPITPMSVIIFSICLGAIWLATVPLTSGLVAHIFGLRYMGTLYGFVFLSHQLGSFFGVWLGGILYDFYGDYTIVWWVGIAVGAFSAIVHLPIREEPLVAQSA